VADNVSSLAPTVPVGPVPPSFSPPTKKVVDKTDPVDALADAIVADVAPEFVGSDVVRVAVNLALTANAIAATTGSLLPGVLGTKCPFSTNIVLTKANVSFLGALFPHVTFTESSLAPVIHPHPVLNIARSISEMDAYSLLSSMVKSKRRIVDIGGNPERHNKYARHNVWSCCPILDAHDSIRQQKRASSKRDLHYCNHTAQLCTCIEPSAYLAIHSLYYLTPDDVGALVQRSSEGLLIAVVHQFADAYGAFANGEATYSVTSPQTITMNVAGNESYAHNDLGWLSKCSHVLPNGRTLAWAKVRSNPIDVTYQFCVIDCAFSPPPESRVLTATLKDNGYYGPVTMSFDTNALTCVAGISLDIAKYSVWSHFGYLVLYDNGAKQTILCPKVLVDMASTYIAGKQRTPDTFKILLSHMRYQCRVLSVPPALVNDAMVSASCLGFTQQLDRELVALHSIVEPVVARMDAHKSALSFVFKKVWRPWHFVAAAAFTTTVAVAGFLCYKKYISPALYPPPPPTMYQDVRRAYYQYRNDSVYRSDEAKFLLYNAPRIFMHHVFPKYTWAAPPLAVVSKVFRNCVRVGAVLVAGFLLFRKRCPAIVPAQPFATYLVDRTSAPFATALIPLPGPVNLPTTAPTQSIPELLSIPLDPGAKFVPGQLVVANLRDSLVAGGIVSTNCIPIVPDNSCHCAIASYVHRGLKPQVRNGDYFSKPMWDLYSSWFDREFDDIFRRADFDPVEATPLAVWLSRFPAGQAARLSKSYERILEHGNARDMHRGSSFTKTELLTKSSTASHTFSSPRLIQSGTDDMNLATGPFMHAFSKSLAQRWSLEDATNSDYLGPVYVSGAAHDQIGAALDAYLLLHPSPRVSEGDFTRFDTNVFTEALHQNADMYERVAHHDCLPVIATVRADVDKSGSDKFDNKFTIKGTRFSGRADTSCGNSPLNYCFTIFAMVMSSLKLGPTDELVSLEQLPSHNEFVRKFEILSFIMGDDSYTMHKCTFPLQLERYLLAIGMQYKAKYHEGPSAIYDATFLSCRFYPTSSQHVLAPCLGKAFAKAGYYVDVPLKSLDAIMRGDAIGRTLQCAVVPFLAEYWSRVRILLGAGKTIISREASHRALHAPRLVEHDAVTMAMLTQVYGLTDDDLSSYKRLLSSATLHSVLNFAPFERAMLIDGTLEDEHSMAHDFT
jgi:hypothetical protein